MGNWRPQHYRGLGKSDGIHDDLLDAAIAAGEAVIAEHPALPPIFTLRHLAHLTEVHYGLLRMIVARHIEDPYRVFRIRKRPSTTNDRRFRIICAPDPSLLTVQRWLARHVLRYAIGKVHTASTAYAPECKLLDAAQPHCVCRWLIKVDIRNFFESITEIAVYRAYRSLGYQPLIAFELARLSTRLGSPTRRRLRKRWLRHDSRRYWVIGEYLTARTGHLPQGAPTSPMLANMAMASLDNEISTFTRKHGLTYTRYADDMTFSTGDRTFDRVKASGIIREVYKIIGRLGLSPNTAKTQVVPPRARKIVLGLLVDRDAPRLTREFKANIRMHLHYLTWSDIGPAKHAQRRGFTAVAGLRNHLQGLGAYAEQIEPEYGRRVKDRLASVAWPL